MTKTGKIVAVLISGIAGGLKLFPTIVGLVAMATVLTQDFGEGIRFWGAFAAFSCTYFLLFGLQKVFDLMLEGEKP